MAKENEITSTEKLLDVIRGGAEEPAAGRDIGEGIAERKPVKGTSLRRSIIGVDISRTNIKLVKMDSKRRVKDFALVPMDARMPLESHEFEVFFKSVMQDFIGRDSKYQIWAAVSASQVELSYYKVPRVPAPQLANVVLLSFRKDYPFTDLERIFDFSVIGDTVDGGTKKTEVIAYSVPRDTVNRTKRLFEKTGCCLAGLTIYPFALQNLFKSSWIETREETYCCLLLGMNWSRIDIFRNGSLMMSRGVKTGINSMVRAIGELLGDIRGTSDEYIAEDEDSGVEGPDMELDQAELAGQLFVKLGDSRVRDEAVLLETTFTKRDLREAIRPVLNRLARQVERTIEHYGLNISGSYIGGVYFQSETAVPNDVPQGLAGFISRPLTILDPFEQNPSLLGLTAAARQAVNAKIENSSFNAAFGLALSNSDTPDILRPYTVKELNAKSRRTDTVITAAAAAALVLLISVYAWQSVILNTKKDQIESLRAKIGEFKPVVTEDMLASLVNQIKRNRQVEAGLAGRYKSLALIKDISEKTPARIRLTNMTMELGLKPEDGEANKPASPPNPGQSRKTVVLEGVVFGESATLEPALAEYLLQLESSPLMTRPRIQSSEFENVQGRQGLVFKVEVELI